MNVWINLCTYFILYCKTERNEGQMKNVLEGTRRNPGRWKRGEQETFDDTSFEGFLQNYEETDQRSDSAFHVKLVQFTEHDTHAGFRLQHCQIQRMWQWL